MNKAGDEFDMNVDVTGPLPGETIKDWPANIQDAIYAAIEKQVECPPDCERVIVRSGFQKDPDPPYLWFVFIRVALWKKTSLLDASGKRIISAAPKGVQ
jgi:hypothetical protein